MKGVQRKCSGNGCCADCDRKSQPATSITTAPAQTPRATSSAFAHDFTDVPVRAEKKETS
jgi:hypothetical protein